MQLNEGLEKLGEKEVINGREYEGEVFVWSSIKTIRLPSTLKRIEAETFSLCEDLKRVEIPNGVEYIGKECFSSSGIEEITFPGTLKGIDTDAFKNCVSLKTVWVEEGCQLKVEEHVERSVQVKYK